jgi:ABC-type lipoprotein release transport system permease subunit
MNILNELDTSFYCDGFIGYFLDKDKNNSIELSDNNFVVKNWDSENILKFLNSFDIPVKLLMWILMLLSVYSLSSLIFNFLITKKEDLKTLYLMGCSNAILRYIILSISLYVSMISIFLGILISSLFIYLQNNFQIINLPSEKIFQLTVLPAYFDVLYFVKYPIFLILFTVFISLYVFNKNFKIDLK